MTGSLLWRGMLAGILAALLATLFARAFAEPQVDRAIAFETAHAHGGDDEADAPVSRATQQGAGLATALVLYGAAVGGLFALVFAACHGRIAACGPRPLALLIAALGFVAVVLVPGIRYPPDPPAVGHADTIQLRTVAYFAMLAVSLTAMVVAARVRALAAARLGGIDALIVAALAYVAVVAAAQAGLPRIDEVPAGFPADLLWRFRVASIGMQLVLWSALAIGFGWLAERRLAAR